MYFDAEVTSKTVTPSPWLQVHLGLDEKTVSPAFLCLHLQNLQIDMVYDILIHQFVAATNSIVWCHRISVVAGGG